MLLSPGLMSSFVRFIRCHLCTWFGVVLLVVFVLPHPSKAVSSASLWGFAPLGVAVDSANTIYVVDDATDSVLKVNSAGKEEMVFNTSPAFTVPQFVAVDSLGNVYVSNADYNGLLRVIKLAPNGTQLLSGYLEQVYGLAVDSADNVWSLSSTGSDWHIYMCSSTTLQPTFTIELAGSTSSVYYMGFAIAADSVFVSVLPNTGIGNAVQRVAWNGTVLASFQPSVHFWQPTGLATDEAAGILYVTDSSSSSVWKFAYDGSVLAQLNVSSPGSSPAQPGNIALFPSGKLVVSDAGNQRLVQLTPEGAHIAVFNNSRPPLSVPVGLATDTAGTTIYVADAGTACVIKMSSTGTLLAVWNASSALGGLTVDSLDDIYVSGYDDLNSVTKLSSSGVVLQVFTTSPPMYYPEGVAVDATTRILYIVDSANNRIVLMAQNGSIVQLLISPDTSNPAFIALDSAGSLYVASSVGSYPLIRIEAAGTVVFNTAALTLYSSVIAVDAEGNFYVPSKYYLYPNYQAAVMKFTTNGTALPFNSTCSPLLGYSITALFVDAASNVYVADQTNHRIVVFAVASVSSASSSSTASSRNSSTTTSSMFTSSALSSSSSSTASSQNSSTAASSVFTSSALSSSALHVSSALSSSPAQAFSSSSVTSSSSSSSPPPPRRPLHPPSSPLCRLLRLSHRCPLLLRPRPLFPHPRLLLLVWQM